MMSFDQATSRRRFLQFMAASPLFAYGSFSAAGEGPTAARNFPIPLCGRRLRTEDLIKSPKDASTCSDFEPVSATTFRPRISATWPRASTMKSLAANREGFLKFQLRPRRLSRQQRVDMSTEILGVK